MRIAAGSHRCDDSRRTRLAPVPHRCAAFTRAQFLIRTGRYADALRQIDFVLELPDRSGDPLLSAAAMLLKAQVLARLGHNGEVASILRQLSPTLRRLPVELYADYEATIAFLLLQEGRRGAR